LARNLTPKWVSRGYGKVNVGANRNKQI
jgi:hypothetical protein